MQGCGAAQRLISIANICVYWIPACAEMTEATAIELCHRFQDEESPCTDGSRMLATAGL
jgi:phage terminase large subunit